MKPAFEFILNPIFVGLFGPTYTTCLCSVDSGVCNQTEILFQTLETLSLTEYVRAGLL